MNRSDSSEGEARAARGYSGFDISKIIIISVAGYATILSLPAVLGAFARGFGLTDQQIGSIGSAELFGVTCGTLIIASQAGRQIKRWLLAACVLVGCGNLLASQSSSFVPLLFGMWLVGVGAGLGGGFAYRAAGQASNPDRVIALVHVSQLSASVLGYQLLNVLLPLYGIEKVLIGYASLSLVALLSVTTLVISGSDEQRRASRIWTLPPRPALLVLLGFWFYCCGEVGLMAFLERIGGAHGFALDDLSNVLSGFAIAGILTSLAVMAIPASWPRKLILLVAVITGELAVFGIINADTVALYAVSCAALGVFYLFTIPIVLGIVSRIDPTGRSTALGLTVASTGQAVGPAVAGTLVVGSSYAMVGWFAATCFAVATAGILTFLWRSSRAETAEVAATGRGPTMSGPRQARAGLTAE